MSDNWLQLVPNDPQFRPSPERAEGARRLLATFVPQADEVSAEIKDGITFFHAGSNWLGVKCPACGADAESWWTGAVEAAYEAEFQSLACVAGCCGAKVSLNELRYVWPVAFGSFALVAMNPNVSNLKATQMAELEQQLGCTLLVVWKHL